MRTIRLVAAALLLAGLATISCRKAAPVAARPSDTAASSFVGIASFGGSPVNVLILITEGTDSAHTLSGYITYQSQTTQFSSISLSAASDTLFFGYTRPTVNYQAWALVQALGLEVHYTEPTGLLPFRLNREVNGHNMTGIWTGDMSSTLLQGQRPVTLTMDQSGGGFTGGAEANFVEPWTFTITTGNVSGNNFQISGTVHGSNTYPTVWNGNYVGFDTISGVWSAGGESEIDGGEFLFSRLFQ